MQIINLDVALRDMKEQAKDLRANDRIPAVVYGHGLETRSLSVPYEPFRKAYNEAGSSTLIDLKVDGAEAVKVLIQDIQLDPISMKPIHVDFHQVNMTEKMHADIPLAFEGESLAVKALGGTLVKAMDHIEVECLPADLPHEIKIDLSTLATFDDMITIGGLNLPKGVVATADPESVIATVDEPLTEEELKKLEESQVGDVADVKSEADEKKEEKAAESEAGNESK